MSELRHPKNKPTPAAWAFKSIDLLQLSAYQNAKPRATQPAIMYTTIVTRTTTTV